MAETGVAHDGESNYPVQIIDASVDGCKLAMPQTSSALFKKGTASLTVQNVGRVMIQPVRQNQALLAATFEYDSKAQRNAMICKLFSGRYTTVSPANSSTRQLISSLWEKTFNG